MSAPIRISLLLPDLRLGGAEASLLQLSGAFAARGCAVDLLLMRPGGQLSERVPASVRRIELNTGGEYRSLLPMARYLRRERPAALLTTLDLTNLVGLLARRVSGVPVRVTIRVATSVSAHKRSSGFKKTLERLALTAIYPWADSIVAVSQGVAADLHAYAGIPAGRIRVIYNPALDDSLEARAQEEPEHPWLRGGDRPVILSAARLSEEKDFPTLLRAFGRVRQERPARLVILGEGPERASLERLIQELGLRDDVALPGYTPNPLASMRRAAVYVLSSRREGMPNAMIQAMACGCPVVSTDCPSGPREVLRGGQYGRLVPVGDEESLGRAILSVLDGDARPVEQGWLDQFRLEVVADQYLDVLLGADHAARAVAV